MLEPLKTCDSDEQSLIDALRHTLGFDFVGLAPVPDTVPPELMWRFASGNTNNRFKRIVLPPGVGVMGIVYRSKQPLVVENVNSDIPRKDEYQFPIVAAEGLVSFFALPLIRGDMLAAILLCAYRSEHAITQELLDNAASFVVSFTERYVPVPVNPLRPLQAAGETVYDETTQKILQAQEEERKRIARELHDGIAQEILLAQIELRKLKYLPSAEQADGIEKSSEYLRQIIKHVNMMAVGLRPTQLDELGLAPAIKAYGLMLQDTYGVTIRADTDSSIKLRSDQETTLYRIMQEAASNACKYSRTEAIDIVLEREGDTVSLTVRDYGKGFDVSHPQIHGGGLGIVGMQERAELVGADFSLYSSKDVGTLVNVSLQNEEG